MPDPLNHRTTAIGPLGPVAMPSGWKASGKPDLRRVRKFAMKRNRQKICRSKPSRLRQWLALLGSATLLAMPACHGAGFAGSDCRDIPKGALPRPAGTYVCQWTDAETSRAAADNFVIYQYEWIDAKLGPFGQRHIPRIAQQLPLVPCPVVVEPSGDAKLDQQRRQAVFEALSKYADISDDRIILGNSEALGLPGYEAQRDGLNVIAGRQSSTSGSGTNSGVYQNAATANPYSGGSVGSSFGGGGVGLNIGTGAY